jgi:prepilin-type N-terminal cleavage/methylation domain-containing protein
MKTFTSKALLKSLRAKKKANGFTLIELMVVVAIVGILTAVGLPELTKAQNKSKDSAAEATLVNAAKECSINLLTEVAATAKAEFAKTQVADQKFESISGDCVEDGSLVATSDSGEFKYTVTLDGAVPGLPMEEEVTSEGD